jgi:hypothetical protein
LQGFVPKLIVFFASSLLAPDEIAERMEAAFPTAEALGCPPAGEIFTGKMLTKSIFAMAFNLQAIKDSKADVLEELGKESNRAFNAFQRHFNKPMEEMDPKQSMWGSSSLTAYAARKSLSWRRWAPLPM